MKKTYALIGDPIDHSLSPLIHNAAFAELRMDCTYTAHRVPEGDLDEGVRRLREMGVSGFNVTMPHKSSIMRYLDSVDEPVEMVGAVNVVDCREGRWHGHNTDMDGFLWPLRERNVEIKGSRVLVFGAGGAARAAAAGLASAGAAYMRVCNRSQERGQKLALYLEELGTSSEYHPIPKSVGDDFDIVVNLSSLGMGGDPFPVDMSGMSPDAVAYDAVYHPIQTNFLDQAGAVGAEIVYGWEMLLGQAELAFEIWTGAEGPIDIMKRAILEHV